MDKETLRLILDKKLTFLTTVAHTTMAWWVSSIVFCLTMLGTFWYFRSALANLPRLNVVCTGVFLFLLSFPVYGGWVIFTIIRLKKEVKKIAASLKIPTDQFFEYRGVGVAVGIGTINFILVVFLWINEWQLLNKIRNVVP